MLLGHLLCLSLSKLSRNWIRDTSINLKQNFKQLSVVLHVLQTTQNWSFHVVVLPRTAKKCTKIYNARAQPLFYSLNLLFSDVPVAVAVVVILNSLVSFRSRFFFESRNAPLKVRMAARIRTTFLSWNKPITASVPFFLCIPSSYTLQTNMRISGLCLGTLENTGDAWMIFVCSWSF